MRRRTFFSIVAAIVLSSPGASAQQLSHSRRIGVLQPQHETDRDARSWVSAFTGQLAELGWSEGVNLDVEYRWYGGDLELLKEYAANLVKRQPDVIFCMSTPTVAALQKLTTTIPIVFVNANNPVGSRFVTSLANPGGNITGFVAFEPAMGGKWLEILREISPNIERVAQIYNPQTHTGQYFESVENAAGTLGIKAVRLPFTQTADLEQSIDEFGRKPNGGMIVLPDASTRVNRDLIVRSAARSKLPAIYAYRMFVDGGGLAYYGPATIDQFRKAAHYVDRILRGAAPAELPVQAPTQFEFVINFKAAEALELTLPPSLIARTTEVIE